MDDNNLEITKEIENLNDIENGEKPVLDFEQEVLNINEDLDMIEETIDGIDKMTDDIKEIKTKKKLKDKIKNKWKSFSKKKKIIIIVVSILFLLILATGLFFIFNNSKKSKSIEKKEDVIFEADNYRYENGKLILLDKSNKELGKYECKNEDEKLCFVAYYEKDEKIDNPKKIDEEGNILNTRSDIINNQYVFIHDSKDENEEKVILFDINSNNTIEEYNAIKYINNNYAIIKDYTGSYGVLEFGDEVKTKIQFNYDNLAMLNDKDKTNLIANESGRNYLIDLNEKILTKAIAMDIVNYNDKFLVAVDDENKYYIYDYKNNLVYDDSFDYIKLFDDYNMFIKDKKMFFNSSDGFKLNEKGFDINNNYKYYQKLYIYDDNNELKETYESFEIEDNTNSISLKINDKEYIINKAEGKLSATTKYINYFDGILYIYDNLDKTNLIGEYKCTNKNVISDNSSSFENCFIASQTPLKQDNDMTQTSSDGIIPILNHRFIFIKDNPNVVSDSNTNIVLYDLQKNKVISKYLNVNTILNTNINEPSFQTESEIHIIAKNNKNKYGIVKINDSDVTPVLAFNYNSIEIISNNYLANNDGYLLIDKSGKELTKKITAKIRGYNSTYLKAVENNMYYIYDYNGNKITKEGYKYIELYDNYFAGIDSSNKLNMYSYKESTTALLNESIQLYADRYYGDGQLAFKINISGDTATIYTLKDGNYTSSVYSLVKNIVENVNTDTQIEGENNE